MPNGLVMRDTIFADGHATRTGIDGLNRASWAVVELDEAGDLVSYMRGVVPADYPQTSQAAEYLGAAYAAQVAGPEATLYDDCANVVRDFGRDRDQWLDEEKAYAGVMKRVIEVDPGANLSSVLKVKGHEDFKDQSKTRHERYCAFGNHLADRHADEAEKLHACDPDEFTTADTLVQRARDVVQVIGAVLPLWPIAVANRSPVAKDPPSEDRAIPRVSESCRHKWALIGKHCARYAERGQVA